MILNNVSFKGHLETTKMEMSTGGSWSGEGIHPGNAIQMGFNSKWNQQISRYTATASTYIPSEGETVLYNQQRHTVEGYEDGAVDQIYKKEGCTFIQTDSLSKNEIEELKNKTKLANLRKKEEESKLREKEKMIQSLIVDLETLEARKNTLLKEIASSSSSQKGQKLQELRQIKEQIAEKEEALAE